MKKIRSEEEFQEALSQPGLLVVDWFAEWCGPCKAIAPYLEQLENENPTVRFVKVDVDELEDLSAQYGIQAMPTFHFYKDGERVDSTRGASKSNVADLVAKHK